MTFWIISAALAIVVAVLFAQAMRAPRRVNAEPAAAYDLRVYRDQLREVDKDLVRGVVSEADAERVRAEISRRILAADAAVHQEASGARDTLGSSRALAVSITVLLVAGSIGLYINLGAYERIGGNVYGDLALKERIERADARLNDRPSQETAEASLPAAQTPVGASPDYIALVEQLRDTVKTRPDDLQGHVLLAQSEANLGNFAAAARALEQVVRLKGDAVSAADFTDYADMLVLAAGGYVSPKAEDVLRAALNLDPQNGTARYYFGLMMAQVDRPDTAFRIWDAQLREGPPDAVWIEPILSQIEDMAFRAGVNYQLPEIGAAKGPSAADIEAAGDMTPLERMEMIGNMVSGLSDRLATEGGPVEDWAQLISALGVLGQTVQASAVYENATEVFAGDTRALDLLLRAGQRAQVAE